MRSRAARFHRVFQLHPVLDLIPALIACFELEGDLVFAAFAKLYREFTIPIGSGQCTHLSPGIFPSLDDDSANRISRRRSDCGDAQHGEDDGNCPACSDVHDRFQWGFSFSTILMAKIVKLPEDSACSSSVGASYGIDPFIARPE